MIQRDFVWEPLQIIGLWDTLIQGLPIGALLGSFRLAPFAAQAARKPMCASGSLWGHFDFGDCAGSGSDSSRR